MKRVYFFLFFLLLCFRICGQERPNIILFLVDDMGWQDTSLPFWTEETQLNRRYHTPSMERLASEGMKFTNAYATPVCTPTRVSIMTGMNAAHHAITNWTSVIKNTPTDHEDDQFGIADWNYNGFSPVEGIPHTVHATALPQILKDNGYFTIHVGKGHWGSMGTPGSNPLNLGFMVNIGGNSIGQPQSFKGVENFGNIPGKATFHAVDNMTEYFGQEIFLTEAMTREAIKSLDAPIRNKQPFFLNMAHYAVHTPIQEDARFYQKYLDAGLEETEAKYASMIEGMDKSLGDLLDYLKIKNIEDNTVVIFMSDNGGLSLTPLRGGEAHTHNLPLRAGKGSMYEGGIRVPMIVRWPGKVEAGAIANQYLIVEDFFPSILEMARVERYRTIQTVDGKSFGPILRNAAYNDDERVLIWHLPNKWQPDGPGINYKSVIRQGDWKLVYHMRNGQMELFNLKDDIRETTDLSKKYPKRVRELSQLLSSKLRGWDARMPKEKGTGIVAPYPDAVWK